MSIVWSFVLLDASARAKNVIRTLRYAVGERRNMPVDVSVRKWEAGHLSVNDHNKNLCTRTLQYK